MLKIDSVSLTISAVPLLNNITIDCLRGSVTALMGPNGAGKTSLLKVISGEYQSSQGRVEINSEAREDWKPSEIAQFMSVLPQSSTLEFAFTAEEVVALGRTPHATGTIRDTEIITAALAWVDASYLAQRSFVQLSGGEKQRVAIARSIVNKPKILFADEPTGNLDKKSSSSITDLIFSLNELIQTTLVLVTHDLSLAEKCDEVYELSEGQLL